jgi:hypothetical protein
MHGPPTQQSLVSTGNGQLVRGRRSQPHQSVIVLMSLLNPFRPRIDPESARIGGETRNTRDHSYTKTVTHGLANVGLERRAYRPSLSVGAVGLSHAFR